MTIGREKKRQHANKCDRRAMMIMTNTREKEREGRDEEGMRKGGEVNRQTCDIRSERNQIENVIN
jgi:hypothetical protein